MSSAGDPLCHSAQLVRVSGESIPPLSRLPQQGTKDLAMPVIWMDALSHQFSLALCEVKRVSTEWELGCVAGLLWAELRCPIQHSDSTQRA